MFFVCQLLFYFILFTLLRNTTVAEKCKILWNAKKSFEHLKRFCVRKNFGLLGHRSIVQLFANFRNI